jgi:DNA helicase HerA-like ATPase
VLGQLGNRVQHALRAFTPRDQKAVKVAAETFRQNPPLDVEKAIGELGVGEALVSFLDAKGTPTPVERAFIVPPRSRLAPLTPQERAEVMNASPLRGRYENAVDRESAYERLRAAAQAASEAAPPPAQAPSRGRAAAEVGMGAAAGALIGKMATSAVRAAGTQIGREIIRGVLGGLLGGGRSKRRW